MARGPSRGGIRLSIEAEHFRETVRAAREFDRDLGNSLRRRIREAAKPAVADARQEAKNLPTSGVAFGPVDSTGLRDTLARAIRLEIAAGKRRSGVFIRARKRHLPEELSWLGSASNREKGWKHPVFGRPANDPERWVRQSFSRPSWFEEAIARHSPQILAATERALRDAIDQINLR